MSSDNGVPYDFSDFSRHNSGLPDRRRSDLLVILVAHQLCRSTRAVRQGCTGRAGRGRSRGVRAGAVVTGQWDAGVQGVESLLRVCLSDAGEKITGCAYRVGLEFTLRAAQPAGFVRNCAAGSPAAFSR